MPCTGEDWYFISEQPAPAPHLADPKACFALRIVLDIASRVIVLVTLPRIMLCTITRIEAEGSGFRWAEGLGFGIWGVGFGDEDNGLRSYGLGFRVQGLWCRVGADFGGSGVECFPESWN